MIESFAQEAPASDNPCRRGWRGRIWQPLLVATVLALVSQILADVSAGSSGLVHLSGLCLKSTSLDLVFMAVAAAGLPIFLSAGSDGRDTNAQALSQGTGRRPGTQQPERQINILLQSLLDGISEPILLLDSDLRVVAVNRAADQAMPSQAGTVSGDTCHALLCGETVSCKECPFFLLRRDNGRHRFERRRGCDPERIEQVEMIPLSVSNDGFDGTMVRITDLTQIKHIERYLIHSEKMSALGLLVSGIVHEINNPNSFITFNLPILRQYLERVVPVLDAAVDPSEPGDWCGMGYDEFRDELFCLLDNLGHGAERITRIVSNLKEVTHPRPAAQASVRIELKDVISKAVTLCRKQIEKHVKRFEVKSPAEPIWLSAAPEALEQVLINLLINAAQAADKEDSWIRLKTYLPETDSKTAVIEVRDNGVGVHPRHLERIFDPFFTTKAPGIGTGLGLSVSLSLMRRMGGHIDVRSEPGRWTAFKVHVPRCLPNDGATQPEISMQRKTEGDRHCEVT
jgi:signal transduction histidine kinase